METREMICRWEGCSEMLPATPGKKFVKCKKCHHMNCVHCKAAHEGVNCATYQAQLQEARSPYRSGDRHSKGGSFSPGTSKNCGGSASPGGVSSPWKPSRPSFEGACQSPGSAYAPSNGAATWKARSTGNQPAAGGATKRVHCATEDCGYEEVVAANATELPCYKCRHTTCLRCNAIHGNLTCEQYQQKFVDDEEEIQAECAKPGCPFIAYVGVCTLQMTCELCGQITCLKCQAVHEFKTCEEYQKQLRRSNSAPPAPPERDHLGTGAEQVLPNGRSSPAVESKSTLRSPAAAAAGKAAMEREASRLQESLVGQSPDETRPKVTVSASQASPVFSAPRAMNAPAPQPEGLMVECCACMAETPLDELEEVAPCAHCICKECVRTSGVSSLTYVVHCPVKPEGGAGCQSQIQESVLKSAMSPQEYKRHQELLSLPVVRCPVEGCSGKFSVRPGMGTLECASCQTEYCVACSANHSGRTCRQFINSVPDAAAAAIHQDEDEQSETASDTSSTPSSEAEQECSACLAVIPVEEIASIEGCGHFLCRNCIHGAKASASTERIRCVVGQGSDTPCQYYIQEAALQTVVAGD
ncbi:uncharacterized protein LOC144121003 isoform X3 [Amblyomma americanum]